MTHLSGCLSVWCNFVTVQKQHQISLWYTENRCAPIHTRHCFPHNGLKDKGTVPDWIDWSLRECMCMYECVTERLSEVRKKREEKV